MGEEKIIINGEELPTPSSIKVSIEDLDTDGSMRSIATGVLHREVLRQGVLSIDIGYNLNTFTDVMKILKMTQPKDFQVELYLPGHGIRGEMKMYSSKKGYEYKRTQAGLKASAFSFKLTQC